ncbi:MAG: hypothetical protein ACK55H_09750 [Cyanobacteriota bacterium]|jgi:hypothetical protein
MTRTADLAARLRELRERSAATDRAAAAALDDLLAAGHHLITTMAALSEVLEREAE